MYSGCSRLLGRVGTEPVLDSSAEVCSQPLVGSDIRSAGSVARMAAAGSPSSGFVKLASAAVAAAGCEALAGEAAVVAVVGAEAAAVAARGAEMERLQRSAGPA